MKAAFTPGPWREWDRIEHRHGVLVTDDAGKIGIANVIDRQGGSDDPTPDAEFWYAQICRANARLIAAAPDLLAALTDCENLLAELATGGAENPELETARAAIAKATKGT